MAHSVECRQAEINEFSTMIPEDISQSLREIDAEFPSTLNALRLPGAMRRSAEDLRVHLPCGHPSSMPSRSERRLEP
jgi:hypothetical protein